MPANVLMAETSPFSPLPPSRVEKQARSGIGDGLFDPARQSRWLSARAHRDAAVGPFRTIPPRALAGLAARPAKLARIAGTAALTTFWATSGSMPSVRAILATISGVKNCITDETRFVATLLISLYRPDVDDKPSVRICSVAVQGRSKGMRHFGDLNWRR